MRRLSGRLGSGSGGSTTVHLGAGRIQCLDQRRGLDLGGNLDVGVDLERHHELSDGLALVVEAGEVDRRQVNVGARRNFVLGETSIVERGHRAPQRIASRIELAGLDVPQGLLVDFDNLADRVPALAPLGRVGSPCLRHQCNCAKQTYYEREDTKGRLHELSSWRRGTTRYYQYAGFSEKSIPSE